MKKEDKYEVTININFLSKIIECNNHLIKLQIWDTAGTEKYQSLTSGYLRGVHGCIIVFDVTKRDSFEKIENWIKTFHYFNKNNNNNVVVVGNKIDKEKERVISKNDAQNFCLQNNFSYFETSALSGENVLNSFQCLTDKIINSDIYNNNELLKKNKNITLNQNKRKGRFNCFRK